MMENPTVEVNDYLSEKFIRIMIPVNRISGLFFEISNKIVDQIRFFRQWPCPYLTIL